MTRLLKICCIIFIFCFMVTVLSGCWDNRDLSELRIATAVGIDKIENGDIELTVQGVIPAVIKARPKGGEKKAYWVYSAQGKTVFSAARNLLTKLDRRAFFAHVDLVVVGEELAREGIMEILDFFERDQETNRKANVIITRGIKAKKVLKAESDVADIPSMHIVNILKNNEVLAKIRSVKLIDLLQGLSSPGFSPPIGAIQMTEEVKQKPQLKDMEIKGTAILKEDRLIGWLDPIETRGLLFAQGEVKGGIITIGNPFQKNKDVTFEIINSSGELDAKFKNGKLDLLIKVDGTGSLGEQQGKGDLTTPEMRKRIQKEVSEVIEKDIRQVVNLAQEEFEYDFFGFAGVVHDKHPDYWKEVKNKWSQVFSNTPVKIEVDWKNESPALIKQRLKPSK